MPRPTRRQFLTTAAGACGALAVPITGAARAEDGTAYELQGIDVSHWQGAVDWPAVRASGKRFAFCKATEGATYTDPTLAANWAGMRAAGLLRSAYHFARPGSDPVAQADRFCNAVGFGSGDLRPVLDLEATDGRTPAEVRDWTVAFVGRMTARIGLPPIIYTGFYFWRDNAGNGSNLNCPLWLANYGTTPSNFVPAAWTTFTIWQYTSTGSCPGVSGNVDRNAFNGTKTMLSWLRLP